MTWNQLLLRQKVDQRLLAESNLASQELTHGTMTYASVRFKMLYLSWPLGVALPLTWSSSWILTSQPFWILVTDCIFNPFLMSLDLWLLTSSSLSELYTLVLIPGLLISDICPVTPHAAAATGPSLAMPWWNGNHCHCNELLNCHIAPWPSVQPVVFWQQEALT